MRSLHKGMLVATPIGLLLWVVILFLLSGYATQMNLNWLLIIILVIIDAMLLVTT